AEDGGPVGEECDSDRRIRQGESRQGDGTDRGDRTRGSSASAADSDDLAGLHARCAAARDFHRGRLRWSKRNRYRRPWRHAVRHGVGHLLRAGILRRDGQAVRRQKSCAARATIATAWQRTSAGPHMNLRPPFAFGKPQNLPAAVIGAATIALLIGGGGCTMEPSYRRPDAPVAEAWPDNTS